MVRFIVYTIALVFPAALQACICANLRTLKENIALYPFIAHVRIEKTFFTNDTSYVDGKMSVTYDLRVNHAIRIIELFKGTPFSTLTEYDVNSSCEIGLKEGEEWILFAEFDTSSNSYFIAACNPSEPFRNSRGERHWNIYYNNARTLTSLQSHFRHSVYGSNFNSGVYQSHYSNGQLEWEAGYLNHQLHGNRRVFYASGNLLVDENFIKGKRHGSLREFSSSGQLIREAEFREGKLIAEKEWADTAQWFFYIPPEELSDWRGKKRSIQVFLKHVYYYRDSKHSISINYNEDGTLESEVIENETARSRVTKTFYESGMVYEVIMEFDKKKVEINQEWDQKGRLLRERKYRNNKLIKDIRKTY